MTKRNTQHHLLRRLGAAFLFFCVLGSPIAAQAAAPSPSPEVLTLSEAATLLRIDAGELEQMALRNEVPARRIGADWRFNREALMAWLNGDWRSMATLERPDATSGQSPLSARELNRVTGAGTSLAQAPTGQGTSPPSNNGEKPIGEAPEEPTAEDVFLRGQKVLLAAGEAAADIGVFYSRSDNPGLVVVGSDIGLANIKQSTFTTLLLGRVGIFNETELFASTTFRDQSSEIFAGGIKIADRDHSELGDVNLGVRHTILNEGPGLPNIIVTFDGHIPTGDTSYAIGGGLALVKSFDPAVLFATMNYRHTFSRDFSDITLLEPKNRFDINLGYALAINDTLTISTSASGVFLDETTFDNARLLQQENYGLQLALTSWLAKGLYIEPSVSFGLSGPGNSVAFGVTAPYTF